MALPVTMYRWDDVGAPQIVDGKPSEYMNVLKKCLVEGYGSKASLGWTIETDIASPPVLALKNNAAVGSGGVALFSAPSDSPGDDVTVEGCNDYVDKDARGRRSSYFGFDRYSTGSRLLSRWFLIGTGKAFYFFCFCESSYSSNSTGTLQNTAFFIGDFESLYPNDPALFISLSGSLDNTSMSWNTSLIYRFSDSSPIKLTKIHPLDGSDFGHEASLVSLGDSMGVGTAATSAANITVLSPIYIFMGTGSLKDSDIYQNQMTPFSRGILPGTVLANSPGYRNDPMPVIKTIDKTEYYLIPSSNSYTGCVWINLKEW
jgi:hypothetical protein